MLSSLDPHRSASPAAPASIVAVVAHSRDVRSEDREALGDSLAARPSDPRRLLVRTCHRVELYAVGTEAAGLDPVDVPAGAVRYDGVEAVRHLIAVACGLDSAVFGETQILHQLREALESRREDPLDPVLDRLLQAALRAGREARTYFTGSPRSLGDAALDRIEARAGSVRDRTMLVVGSGRMGRLAAFAARRRGATLRIVSRTTARAAALAGDVGGAAGSLDEHLADPLPAGIVIALAGHWPIVDADIARLAEAGTPVIDLSSPPAIGPRERDRLGGTFVSVDDFAAEDPDAPDARVRLRLERLVSRAGGDYCHWLRARAAVPAITAVVSNAEARRVEELAWLRRRLPELSEEELAAVDQMSHRLVAALLHEPLAALTGDDDGQLEPAARTLFGI